jgi:hypothetical protein
VIALASGAVLPSARPVGAAGFRPQPSAASHPRTAAQARAAFGLADPPWQYRPMFTYDLEQDVDAKTQLLREMAGREIRHILLGADQYSDSADYLTPAFFDQTRDLLEAARGLGLHVTLADDYAYPSASADGLVVAHDPRCRLQAMVEVAPGVYRVRKGSIESPLFSLDVVRRYPDLLNFDCMRYLLDITQRQYERRLREFFPTGGGDTVVGFYTNEPQVDPDAYGTTGAPAQAAVLWTSDFPRYFQARNGYDIRPRLQDLFRDRVPSSYRVRIDYWRTLAERLGAAYYGPISRWSEQHGVGYTGFLFEDDSVKFSNRRAADYFRWTKAMTAPGTDIVSREDNYAHHLHRASSAASEAGRAWAHVDGTNITFPGTRPQDLKGWADKVLVHGVNNYMLFYCCSHGNTAGNYIGLRWQPWIDRLPSWSRYFARISQQISGGTSGAQVALLDPWSTLVGGMAMGWDANTRTVSNGPTELADAQVLAVAQTLDEHQVQWNFMTEGFLPGAVRGSWLRGGSGERYEALILPHEAFIPLPVLRSVRTFWQGGGTVIAVGTVPSMAAEGPGTESRAVRALSTEIFGTSGANLPATVTENQSAGGGHAYFVPAGREGVLGAILEARVRLLAQPLGGRDGLLAHTRRYPGLDVHLLANTLPPPSSPVGRIPEAADPAREIPNGTLPTEGAPVDSVWRFEGAGLPEIWDTETGGRSPAPVYWTEGGRTIVPVRLQNTGSVVVAIRSGDPESRPHLTRADLPVPSVTVRRGVIHVDALASANGTYRFEGSYRGTRFEGEVAVTDVPPGVDLSPGWKLCFPPQSARATPTFTTGIQGGTCQRRNTGDWRLPDPETGAPPVVEATVGTYARSFGRVPEREDLRWTLDLGEVAETSRVAVNGVEVGDRNWTPYTFDVTEHLGVRNSVRVLVQSAMLVSQAAGILGPARLFPSKRVSLRVPLPR